MWKVLEENSGLFWGGRSWYWIRRYLATRVRRAGGQLDRSMSQTNDCYVYRLQGCHAVNFLQKGSNVWEEFAVFISRSNRLTHTAENCALNIHCRESLTSQKWLRFSDVFSAVHLWENMKLRGGCLTSSLVAAQVTHKCLSISCQLCCLSICLGKLRKSTVNVSDDV